ncbi:hypothetical protein [Fibrobacter sp.]|uniref:hypothetical protein n=1 Tax=Fibrobacter sp. TaxID=35828 RepID=UPI0025BCE54D|nr:hypothetical protein [Fibrobacter sp.]MCI6438045.1 hypothetical protein [Fibrobacter sp.]MDD7497902.1 hypothetical protein [Fibrobacter sp.]MDY5723844.1 hypothetical protein [Fibrobacter sp.]
MKKLALAVLSVVSLALMACGPSKLEIQEASTQSDVLLEVRQVLNDSISLFVGNTLYLNSKQMITDDMYPLLVSTRDPAELEKPTATDILNNDEEFLNYLRRKAPDFVNVGVVIGETAYNEIGFEEKDAVEKLSKIFKKVQGGTLVLFHEKAGELTDMKKLY